MKKVWIVLLVGLLALAVTAPALAWEFNMKGEYEYRLKYFARTGNLDLFGFAPVQDTALAGNWVGFSGPDIYNRGAVTAFPANASSAGFSGGRNEVITRGGFSTWGSDAYFCDSRLTLYPEIRVNPAIRVHGVYTVGGYRNKYNQNGVTAGVFGDGIGTPPFERFYMAQTSNNAYDTASIGSWEQFRATVQTPIGILSYGVKDFPFGTGATLGNNTRTEAFVTVVPYGPLTFIHGIWLANAGSFGFDGWNEVPDGGIKDRFFQGAFFLYNNADLQVGGGWIGRYAHANRGDLLGPVVLAAPAAGETIGTDVNLNFWLLHFKYNNGRFFANAEYSWVTIDIYSALFGGAAAATPKKPNYLELQHAFAEAGVMAGPAKVTFMAAWSPGQNLANPATFPGITTTKSAPYPINYQAMEPYNTLMFYTYAGGNNQFNWTFGADGHGCMGDAMALATRLDYAVASNLNVWGTYLWAERLEKDGYLAGQFGASGTADGIAGISLAAGATGAGSFRGAVGGTNPFAGNKFLGWEADAGVDWKLLEGMTMYFKYAYWQPGDWFDWAYQGLTIVGGAATTRPLGKDPIQSVQGSFLINF